MAGRRVSRGAVLPTETAGKPPGPALFGPVAYDPVISRLAGAAVTAIAAAPAAARAGPEAGRVNRAVPGCARYMRNDLG